MPVKVANYEAVVRDRDLVAELGLEFDLVVLDEAQRIKNRTSNTSEAVRALRRKRSWALTGTPVENRAEDLVSLFEFVAPGHLNDRMPPRALGAAAADHVLRRTKDKVLKDMPPWYSIAPNRASRFSSRPRVSTHWLKTSDFLPLAWISSSSASRQSSFALWPVAVSKLQICLSLSTSSKTFWIVASWPSAESRSTPSSSARR